MVDDDLREELLTAERRGWESLCNGTGDVVYGELMTADGVMVLANGELMDRAAVVAALGQSPPWNRYEIDEVRLVDPGPDSAALVYLGSAFRDEPEPAFVGLMTSVYVRRDGAWRLSVYQQTPVRSGRRE